MWVGSDGFGARVGSGRAGSESSATVGAWTLTRRSMARVRRKLAEDAEVVFPELVGELDCVTFCVGFAACRAFLGLGGDSVVVMAEFVEKHVHELECGGCRPRRSG